MCIRDRWGRRGPGGGRGTARAGGDGGREPHRHVPASGPRGPGPGCPGRSRRDPESSQGGSLTAGPVAAKVAGGSASAEDPPAVRWWQRPGWALLPLRLFLGGTYLLSLIHISEPTRLLSISY